MDKPPPDTSAPSSSSPDEWVSKVPISIREGRTPPPSSQAIFLLTGALAGASIVPVELLWPYVTSPSRWKQPIPRGLNWTTARPLMWRGGVRFWVFDIARYKVEPLQIPVWLKGGLSGAAGGLAEMLPQILYKESKRPNMMGLAAQPVKLFFCFGTYTYLSTTLSPKQLPPKPFWWCWLMGAAAGGVGSSIIAAAEGIRGNALWRSMVPKGAATIGTVIAVQVTSCASLLPYNRFIPNGRY